MDPAAARALVLARTRVACPPAVPELRLHLAEDMDALWSDLARELSAAELPPPFWAFAWLGGQALARHLLDRPGEVAGRRVLDLGSGSGLCGLAARRAGAAAVRAVDVDPVAGAAARLNAALNRLDLVVDVRDLLDDPPPDVDLVLAGDLCYDATMTARVLPWLTAARAAGARVLLGDPGRHYLPQSGLTLLSEHDVDTTRELEGVLRRRVRVLELA